MQAPKEKSALLRGAVFVLNVVLKDSAARKSRFLLASRLADQEIGYLQRGFMQRSFRTVADTSSNNGRRSQVTSTDRKRRYVIDLVIRLQLRCAFGFGLHA